MACRSHTPGSLICLLITIAVSVTYSNPFIDSPLFHIRFVLEDTKQLGTWFCLDPYFLPRVDISCLHSR